MPDYAFYCVIAGMKNFNIFCLSIPLISIMFWNTENFFDYFDNGYSDSDSEFSSRGAKHWTKARFSNKVDGVAKTLLWAGVPEVVGLAEVESKFVLRCLCDGDLLRKLNYRFVHFESHDSRGIDCALMYCADSMALVDSRPVAVVSSDTLSGITDTLRTRDILYVCLLRRSDGRLWHFLVNHHPSKYGGKSSSRGRLAAMRTLISLTDSLVASGERNIIAMGDFNDSPLSEAFRMADGRLVNLGARLLEDEPASGTIRYRGKWELIDNFLVSESVAESSSMKILRPSFLLERDSRYPGEKPRRTYIGPRYNAGLSDHLPVVIRPDQ